jgi:hypothetical protein
MMPNNSDIFRLALAVALSTLATVGPELACAVESTRRDADHGAHSQAPMQDHSANPSASSAKPDSENHDSIGDKRGSRVGNGSGGKIEPTTPWPRLKSGDENE